MAKVIMEDTEHTALVLKASLLETRVRVLEEKLRDRPSLIDDVAEFMRKFEQPIGSQRIDYLTDATDDMRMEWLAEEVNETDDALAAGLLPEYIDGNLDAVYIAIGSALTKYGPAAIKRAWAEIHAANMRKEKSPDGKKVRKPEGWVEPDIAKALRGE